MRGAETVYWLYTGQIQDGTGLYYYNARYYDPYLGRFISPDTIVPGMANPQAFNRYSYVLNRPLVANDPSGHSPIPWEYLVAAAAVAGSLVGYGIQVYNNYQQGKTAWDAWTEPIIAGFIETPCWDATTSRNPDYDSFGISAGGGSLELVRDTDGGHYLAPGISAGLSRGFVSGQLVQGWMCQPDAPSQEDLQNYLTGSGASVQVGALFGVTYSWNPSGSSIEFGLYSPQAGMTVFNSEFLGRITPSPGAPFPLPYNPMTGGYDHGYGAGGLLSDSLLR